VAWLGVVWCGGAVRCRGVVVVVVVVRVVVVAVWVWVERGKEGR
jgi:hypothetical protein